MSRLKVIVAWQDETDEIHYLSGFADVDHEQTVDRIYGSAFGSRFSNVMPNISNATTTVHWTGNPNHGERGFNDIHEEIESRRQIEAGREKLR